MNETSRGLSNDLRSTTSASGSLHGNATGQMVGQNNHFTELDSLGETFNVSRFLSGPVSTIASAETLPWDFTDPLGIATGGSPNQYRPWECDLAPTSTNKTSLYMPSNSGSLIHQSGTGAFSYYSAQQTQQDHGGNVYLNGNEHCLPSFESQFQQQNIMNQTCCYPESSPVAQYLLTNDNRSSIMQKSPGFLPSRKTQRQMALGSINVNGPFRKKSRTSSLESSDATSSSSSSEATPPGQVPAISSTENKMIIGAVVHPTDDKSQDSGKKKRKRCGDCVGCLRKINCSDCAPCRNDKSHQICKMRRCEKLIDKKPKKPQVKTTKSIPNSKTEHKLQDNSVVSIPYNGSINDSSSTWNFPTIQNPSSMPISQTSQPWQYSLSMGPPSITATSNVLTSQHMNHKLLDSVKSNNSTTTVEATKSVSSYREIAGSSPLYVGLNVAAPISPSRIHLPPINNAYNFPYTTMSSYTSTTRTEQNIVHTVSRPSNYQTLHSGFMATNQITANDRFLSNQLSGNYLPGFHLHPSSEVNSLDYNNVESCSNRSSGDISRTDSPDSTTNALTTKTTTKYAVSGGKKLLETYEDVSCQNFQDVSFSELFT